MNIRNLAFLLISILLLTTAACGGDDEPAPEKTAAKLIYRGASLRDGATVDANSLTSVTLQFNNVIKVVTPSGITLNGQQASASADGMDLKITFSLSLKTEYTLSVAAGSLALASDSKVTNEAITLRFNTEAGLDPADVTASPVNPKATPEAKALYNTLRADYGTKMRSGAMGGVCWETTYTDFLKSQTGAYPAVVGFDYGHLAYSPANWINYGDITPVKKVHDMGCIVQIQWHWNVPVSEGSSTLAFYSDNNKFNPANILVDGTWENKVALADVEKLASYMMLLQDAKIPVLWRPFHEAAGDYRWGAWFWWGTKGTQVTKQLYQWLYKKLTDEYGLNNLIWVWTVCTSSEGKPAAVEVMKEAYPGNDYVDIVGPDIYPAATLTDQSAEFNLVKAVADGKKMVALTECGNLVSPESSYTSHALWAYFMQWYDMNNGSYGFYNYKGPDQWLRTIESPYVISIK